MRRFVNKELIKMNKHLKQIKNNPSFKTILKQLDQDNHISLSQLKGSSKELVITLLSQHKNKILYFSPNQNDAEENLRNMKAYQDIFKINVEYSYYFYSHYGHSFFDPFIYNEKIKTLDQASHLGSNPQIILTTKEGFQEKIPYTSKFISIHKAKKYNRDELSKHLISMGYKRVDYIEVPGEFAVRGYILDIFSEGQNQPARIEFFDDDIEQIKTFDLKTHRTHSKNIFKVNVKAVSKNKEPKSHDGYFHDALLIYDDNENDFIDYKNFSQSIEIQSCLCTETPKKMILQTPFDSIQTNLWTIKSRIDHLIDFIKQLPKNHQLFLSSLSEGESHYLKKLLNEKLDHLPPQIHFIQSQLITGFQSENECLTLLTESEIFKRYQTRLSTLKIGHRGLTKTFKTLTPGDYVVHYSYGVGLYKGFDQIEIQKKEQEMLIIEYADESILYVPKDQFYLIEKYIGVGSKPPKLDSLNSSRWSKKKMEARNAIFDYAAKILDLEAKRKSVQGFSFHTEYEEIYDFEKSFRFEETPDQQQSIDEIKIDLTKDKPMNRLLLGDAGFGKTEVAGRAAFITAMNEKQTAVLVPTTILAEQHYKTFLERMAEYPLRIGVLSRFCTKSEQKKTLEDLKKGLIDIIIGTHRLVQKDVEFKDLGLLIIDEEQRFGVHHKDYLIQKYPLINVLSLSATPIPRTLYLSLVGVRNMSAIMTPPTERKPIITKIIKEDWNTVKDAILEELKRKGQIFFVHNRIYSIESIKEKLKSLIPHLNIGIAHGRLPEEELKQVMEKFFHGDIHLLLSTSIIESGLDLPNANTLIVHHAEQFGLAELYQIRGRIGRYIRQAHAFFIVDPKNNQDQRIKKRIEAIHEFSKPGGGYLVALKDLEIRGAGNILGVTQSGHMAQIGFDLYCRLLKETVNLLKGAPINPHYEVHLYLKDEGFFPKHYIFDFHTRFYYYKKLAQASNKEEIDQIQMELKDQFGHCPVEVILLIKQFLIKCLARTQNIVKIEQKKTTITFHMKNNTTQHLKYNTRKPAAESIVNHLLKKEAS